MPSFELSGHRAKVGSDDIALHAAIEAVGNILFCKWLAYLIYCEVSTFLFLSDTIEGALLMSHSILVVINTVLLLVSIRISLKGTLINARPRRNIVKVIKFREHVQWCWIFLSVVTLVLWRRSTLDTTCSVETVHLVWWIGCFGICLNLAGLVSVHSMKGRPRQVHKLDKMESDMTVEEVIRKRWSKRAHQGAILIGLQPDESFQSMASLFSDFLETNVDVVHGDTLAALMELHKKQRRRREQLAQQISSATDLPAHSPVSDMPDMPPLRSMEWMTDIHLLSDIMHFAMGSYGWTYFLVRSSFRGFWQIVDAYVRNWHTMADPGTFITKTVIMKCTGLPDEDILYISVKNTFTCLPFYVAFDHKNKKLVVTIRGTLSVEDVLVDLLAEPTHEEDLQVPGVTGRAYVHSGILKCSRELLRRLLHECPENPHGRPLLDHARDVLRELRGEEAVEEYDLVLTGHSLGAGVASVLAVLFHMKNIPVQCIAYSPPGWVVSLNLARYMERFTVTVVYGADVVARMGLVTLWNLKIDLLSIIKDCDIPKHEILGNWVETMFATVVGQPHNTHTEPNPHNSWEPGSEAEEEVRRYQEHIQAAIDDSRASRDKHPRLYMPGCVIYLLPHVTARHWFCTDSVEYRGIFLRGDSIHFDEIMLQKSMFEHHTPWNVEKVLAWMSEREVIPRHAEDGEEEEGEEGGTSATEERGVEEQNKKKDD